MANPTYGFDNNSATNLYPSADSEVDLPLSVIPQRPAQFAFKQPQRRDSGNYAGSGGYTATYSQGQYGETLGDDYEPKSSGVIDWETRGPRVDDMRGAKWGVSSGSKTGHMSDDEDESEETVVSVSTPHTALPPALPPPPPPSNMQHTQIPLPTSSSVLLNPYEIPQHPPRRTYQLSDPPVVNHTPIPSDSTYPYPPSLHSQTGYAQTDFLPPHSQASTVYSHGSEGIQVTYDSQHPPLSGQVHPMDPSNPTGPPY